MKLSEMGAREGAAALCALVPHLEAIAGDEALRGFCTITDGTLQTAVQFFRSMLSV